MQLQPAQLLEPVIAPVRTRAGGDTDSGGKSFWERLAQHEPARASIRQSDRPKQPEEPVDSTRAEGTVKASEEGLDEGDQPPPAVAAHAPSREPREQSSQAERDELTLAAAITAGFQPLTIHTLNNQLLRVDASLSPQRVWQTDAPAGQTTGPGDESSAGRSVDTPSSPENPENPEHAEQSRTSVRDRDIVHAQVGFAHSAKDSSDRRQEPATHQTVTESSQTAPAPPAPPQQQSANSAVAQSAPATVAAVAGGITPNTPKGGESAAAKPTPVASPPTAPIGGDSGRKTGADAQMPRWDAQKPATDAQRGGGNAAPARNAAMIAAQVTKGLAVALSRADGTVTLRLNPESLGFVRIKLEMGKGTVHARFEASTNQARQLLEQSSETLRSSLEAKGWETSQVRVELLREVDPAAEILRKLEQQAASALERQAAQDATAGREQWTGGSGGDREHKQEAPDLPSHGSDEAAGTEVSGQIAGSSDGSASVGLFSRIDTVV